ncbi:hypothetical protein A2769_02000 [Candidatus Daviesbacteria bacterium RIFCSPHIGHO2_01_FULL_37_27]|nr:MAG: hypothetical protein A2769_02000 [Candidatus Daviesbacteria bacterium RIFCSPHIGHO2_01_FULL_37_27]
MRKIVAILVGLTPFFIAPQPTFAHSFGKLYNLPVPFWMYLYGGVAAIVASFLVIGYFINKTNPSNNYPTINLSKFRFVTFLTSAWFLTVLKGISVFLFLLTIVAGFVGIDFPSFNIGMTLFWIIFALGLTYLTAFIGNIYALINPLKVGADVVEKILGEKIKGIVKYPERLGYYPALVFYFLFIWIELFAETGPLQLSMILVQYVMLNVLGVALVGKNAWFTYCEFFSVFFRLIGKMAPVECKRGKLFLRPPFVGLIKEKAEHFSLLLFILFMLSSTAFDGFRETTPFYRLYWQNLDDVFRPILGANSYETYQTLALFLSPFVFLSVYLLLIWLAKAVTNTKLSLRELSLQFAFSLIPIAFVYNVAHYYTLVVTEGSNMGRLISDPFGKNWNLFGTANWPNIPTVDTNFVWHSQVAFILLGHIVGVYIAHIIALKVFPSHKKALISQFPLLILMVIYTMAGLWILSQPITSGLE